MIYKETHMNYVDGFITPVPNSNKEIYIQLAEKVSAIFKKHGALNYIECWGDDVPEGKQTSFPMAVQCKEDETVVFSWITWPSREVRDAGMKKAMEEMHKGGVSDMPFDGKRMIFGGFTVIVEK